MQPLVVLVATLTFGIIAVQCRHSPILLLPGLMGSRLEVLDDRKDCSTGGKYSSLWLSKSRIIFSRSTQCAVEELTLNANFDALYPGVHVKVPYFGELAGVDTLTDWLSGLTSAVEYYSNLISYFKGLGYKKNQDLRSAPYDWRLASDELERRQYYKELKKLIEDMYNENGKTAVTLVVHSMGGPVSLHFLTGYNTQIINQAWKDTYIHAYVTLSGAWMGGVKAVAAPIIGMPDDGIPIKPEKMVPAARTFESTPFLMPKASVFEDKVLISTPSKKYTALDYKELFHDIGYTRGYDTFKRISLINPGYPAPNVDTFCFYGIDVKTPEKYTFVKNFKPDVSTIGWKPVIEYGDGDGTVNTKSSEVCHRWKSMKKNSFQEVRFQGVDHMDIVKSKKVLQHIAVIVGVSPKLRFLQLMKDAVNVNK